VTVSSELQAANGRPVVPVRRGLPSVAAGLAVLRPWYWPVSWGPAALGYVMASGSWLPPAGSEPRVATAALVLGPLLWGAVLTLNDRYDVVSDRASPRKATTPVVTGRLTLHDLAGLQTWFTTASLIVAAVVGPVLVAGTAGVLVLSWAYSAPPLRLKGRPGADIAANAVAVGLLAPLCGWSLIRPLLEYPPALAITGTLIAVALYIPTTVIDRDADLLAGDRTFAVRFGPRMAYWAGLSAWTVSTVLWLIGCVRGLVPPGQVPWQMLSCTGMLGLYAGLMRRPSIARLALVFTVFAIPAALFLAGVVAGHPVAGVLAP
jgi:chlorophyll synthase